MDGGEKEDDEKKEEMNDRETVFFLFPFSRLFLGSSSVEGGNGRSEKNPALGPNLRSRRTEKLFSSISELYLGAEAGVRGASGHYGTKPGRFETSNDSLSHQLKRKGVSEGAKRAARSKRMSERCVQTNIRTSGWPSTYVPILGCSEPLCTLSRMLWR